MAMYSTNICSPRANRSNGERLSHSFHSSGSCSYVIAPDSHINGAGLSRQPSEDGPAHGTDASMGRLTGHSRPSVRPAVAGAQIAAISNTFPAAAAE
jgi:hypothetical protein